MWARSHELAGEFYNFRNENAERYIKAVTWLIEHVNRESGDDEVCMSLFHSQFYSFSFFAVRFSTESVAATLLRTQRGAHILCSCIFCSFEVYITCIMKLIKNMTIIKVDCLQMLHILTLHGIRRNK